jgi:hypothetical protein
VISRYILTSSRTKTPIIQNGNNTYRLTHTRYIDSKNISSTNSSLSPKATTPTQTITDSTNSGVILGSMEETPDPLSNRSIGFTRDQTIGDQVRQAIGKAEWDKKVRFFILFNFLQVGTH